MPHAVTSRILFIDAYDSFSNNIVSLLETRLPDIEVITIKIDEQIANFPAFLKAFDAVVAGPGPGHPASLKDVGIISRLWQLEEEDLLPVLGICLGFQSLVSAFGGAIVPLPAPRHGIVRNVTHSNTSIFEGVGSIAPVQYHSLHAQIQRDACPQCPIWYHDYYPPSKGTEELEPLAWDFAASNSTLTQIPGQLANPGAILMAVKHRKKPFYGLQFHPESICSDAGCMQVVANWWSEAEQWNKQRKTGNSASGCGEKLARPLPPVHSSIHLRTSSRSSSLGDDCTVIESNSDILDRVNAYASPRKSRVVINRVLPTGKITVPQVYELLKTHGGDAVVLDSEPHQRADVGTHSIIGALEQETLRLDYHIGCVTVRAHRGKLNELIDLGDYGDGIFDLLKAFVELNRTSGGNPEVPFWGGLIGYISYEACLETLNMKSPDSTGKPDISFAFVERSVVIDHQHQQIHIQSIKSDDDAWVSMIASRLASCTSAPQEVPSVKLGPAISEPDASSYKLKIRKCQEYIHSGNSYELCLTNRVSITARHVPNAWPLYLRLRSLNAAPFSAYMRLGRLTLLSSSPERFMSWTRPSRSPDAFAREEKSTVQFRPIKGTAKRYPNGPDQPAITLEQATALLSTPKERAENLMIVDLIRHDLHGVVGSGNVCVPKLMVVEEYATLFQLVTVVEGTLINQQLGLSDPPSLVTSPRSSPCSSCPNTPPLPARSLTSSGSLGSYASSNDPRAPKTGIDVLAASLPPGSMTGAPKRRSCALLREIEGRQPRGIYSGIVGYMDVGGGGDFSVVIRSAFRWDSDTVSEEKNDHEKRDTWTVGAGGAITSLSTEEGEWEEMAAKLESTLRMFEQTSR
ncbi:MAG: hypothetical protein LQ338_004898 [Usnochroma carphineum]|nr:MAG: hypothetical protein LQ338_004898 [Usnochroma carphineum]